MFSISSNYFRRILKIKWILNVTLGHFLRTLCSVSVPTILLRGSAVLVSLIRILGGGEFKGSGSCQVGAGYVQGRQLGQLVGDGSEDPVGMFVFVDGELVIVFVAGVMVEVETTNGLFYRDIAAALVCFSLTDK